MVIFIVVGCELLNVNGVRVVLFCVIIWWKSFWFCGIRERSEMLKFLVDFLKIVMELGFLLKDMMLFFIYFKVRIWFYIL